MSSDLHTALQRLMNPDGLGGTPKTTGADAGSSQNAVASSRSQTGFTGVTLHKRTQRYEAHIWADKKQIYLGSYNIKSQAARVHDIMSLKIGKAVIDTESRSSSRAANAGEINYPVGDYSDIQPHLATISQHDLVVTLRNYGKSLNATGHPNSNTAPPASMAPSTSTGGGSSSNTIATSTTPPRIPINLPSQHQYQFQTNPISQLARASSLPDDRRTRKRKQERPSSALDNPQWQVEEPVAGLGLQRYPSASLPFGLPRPTKVLGRSGSVGAPLPLFQAARQQRQQPSIDDLASNFGDLPHPPPLQLGSQQHHASGIETGPAAALAGVANYNFLQAPRNREA